MEELGTPPEIEQVDSHNNSSESVQNVQSSQNPFLKPQVIIVICILLMIIFALIGYVVGNKQDKTVIPDVGEIIIDDEDRQKSPDKRPTTVPEVTKESRREANDEAKQDTYLWEVGEAPDFNGVTEWINTDPLTISDLNGKPVQLVFCTPTLDNSFCSAVVTPVMEWADEYASEGLVTIWINTPYQIHGDYSSKHNEYRKISLEFIDKYNIDVPIAQDPNSALLKPFTVQAWPDIMYIDKHGTLLKPANLPPAGFAKYDSYELSLKEMMGR